jgi:hypothetical protein
MSKVRAPRAGAAGERRRKGRCRPTPKWLMRRSDVDQVARSRCLLLLSVLSGEVPVTQAIGSAKISRATYYQWETRALRAMLAALNPLSGSAADGSADLSAATARIGQLQSALKRLEQDKRRSQRLLLLTRKLMRGGTLKSAHRGRWPKAKRSPASVPTMPPGASSP